MTRNNYQEVKQLVHNFLGNQCEKCKSKEGLHIHHKDNDRTNNTISNVALLCSKCHHSLHSKQQKEVVKKIRKQGNIEYKGTAKGVYTKKCEKCGKVITSLYKAQLAFNFKSHSIKCKKVKEDGL